MSQCRGVKANGEQCSATVEPPQEYCWWHDPANAEKRQRAASQGGKAKANGEVRALREWLKTLTEQVVNGDLETSRGAVANQLISTQIKLLELERRVKETDVLAAEIEKLKQEFGRAS